MLRVGTSQPRDILGRIVMQGIGSERVAQRARTKRTGAAIGFAAPVVIDNR